jgi:membrane-bound metal-dependent hydrolase YbcI (DUF457 family)
MFIGHHAVAFGAKRVAPRMSLGVLVLAATWLDLVWPLFLILGIEHVRIRGGRNPFLLLDFYDYPWTHSLVAAAGWSIAFAVVYWIFTRYGRGAVIAGIAVFSHWLLDFFTHLPDLPLTPGENATRVGLRLWESPVATIVIEGVLFAAGVWIYIRATKPRDRTGTFALMVFVIFLILAYIASLTSPPPPNAATVGWAALASWLLPLWAWWIDRHREART